MANSIITPVLTEQTITVQAHDSDPTLPAWSPIMLLKHIITTIISSDQNLSIIDEYTVSSTDYIIISCKNDMGACFSISTPHRNAQSSGAYKVYSQNYSCIAGHYYGNQSFVSAHSGLTGTISTNPGREITIVSIMLGNSMHQVLLKNTENASVVIDLFIYAIFTNHDGNEHIAVRGRQLSTTSPRTLYVSASTSYISFDIIYPILGPTESIDTYVFEPVGYYRQPSDSTAGLTPMYNVHYDGKLLYALFNGAGLVTKSTGTITVVNNISIYSLLNCVLVLKSPDDE